MEGDQWSPWCLTESDGRAWMRRIYTLMDVKQNRIGVNRISCRLLEGDRWSPWCARNRMVERGCVNQPNLELCPWTNFIRPDPTHLCRPILSGFCEAKTREDWSTQMGRIWADRMKFVHGQSCKICGDSIRQRTAATVRRTVPTAVGSDSPPRGTRQQTAHSHEVDRHGTM